MHNMIVYSTNIKIAILKIIMCFFVPGSSR